MAVKFTNNAATTLAAGINSSVTSISVTDGSVFPALTGSDHFYVTFDDTTNREIVKVTARSGNTLTVVRGQDNTTAQAFNSGDKAELRVVAALLEDITTEVTSTLSVDTFTGDGTTTAFTLSQAPSSEDNLIVFIEGAYQNPGDFVLSGTTLTLDEAPVDERNIIVYHVKGAVSGNNLNQDSFTADGNTAAFTLSIAPIHENNTQVFIDGVYQQKNSYSVSGTTLTLDANPSNGATVEVMTFTQTDVNTLPASFVSGLTEVTAVGADHFMIFDATDSALKKSLVSDVLESATSISTSADATAITIDSSENVTFTNNVTINSGQLTAGGLAYPTSDGTNGQVLTTDGAGTLSFSTISGYTDSDVETYLNTSEIYTDPTNNRLGIGTSSPAAKLHLNSTSTTAIMFDSDASTQQYELGVGYGGVGTSSFYLYDNTANATRLVINTSGNVTFTGSGTFGSNVTALTNFNSTTGNDLRLNAGSVNRDIFMQVNGSTLMTVQGSTGRVGIGISSPTHGLTVSDIDGGDDAEMRRITISSQTHGVNSGFRFDSESANGTARAGGYYFQPGDTDDTTYLGLSSDDAGYDLVVTRAGNVGIGTTTPTQARLEVTQAYNAFTRAMIISNGTEDPGSTYDDLVLNSADVPTVRLTETGSGQQMTLAVGNENFNTAIIGATGQLKFATNNAHDLNGYIDTNTRMTIDTSGRVTMPYQPSFSTSGASYTQSTGSYSRINPSTEVHDNGNNYSNGTFTAPVAGTYQFGFWGLIYPHYETEVHTLRYFKNGSALPAGTEVQAGGDTHAHQDVSGSMILVLSANDTVDLRLLRGSGTYTAYGGQWNMWGILLH